MTKRFSLCIILILGCFNQLFAEPSKAVTYFQSTPVNLMDWGCFKVESALRNIKVEGIKSIAFVSEYDAQRNILSFGGLAFPENEEMLKGNRSAMEKLCISIMNKMREYLLVDLKTGKCLFTSCLSGYFSTKIINVPIEYYEELDKISHLSITLKVGDELIEYKGKLLGIQFKFK